MQKETPIWEATVHHDKRLANLFVFLLICTLLKNWSWLYLIIEQNFFDVYIYMYNRKIYEASLGKHLTGAVRVRESACRRILRLLWYHLSYIMRRISQEGLQEFYHRRSSLKKTSNLAVSGRAWVKFSCLTNTYKV